MQWDKYYKETLRKKNIKIEKDDKTRPVIYDRKNIDIKNIYNKPNNNVLGDINNNNQINLNLNSFKTNYMSYIPVCNDFLANEPLWLVPFLNHNYIWEKNNK